MFKGVAFVFLGLIAVSTPLKAQLLNLSINGTVTGAQTTVQCNFASAPGCLATYPGGTLSEQFLAVFNFSLPPANLGQGANPFTYGNPRSSGLWSGTIVNTNGFLTGQDLSFIREDSSCMFGAVGCRVVLASATTFNVVGGIPEPGTWATMLLGFFLVGSVLRKQAVGRAIDYGTARVA